MTETSHDRPKVARSNGRTKGLTIDRIYTTAGTHPYDEVMWERRDVVQQNWKTGETIFEQRGVEFPDFWSVNASTIVTTKYFRGAVGTDVREWSLKQLINRVVTTYRAAGEQHGYFATPGDAEVFEHELTWALLHQVFSFNSPVWFNVGTSSPQQVSACFILAVDDTMDSILNWYREEGLIFKGGSGAGLVPTPRPAPSSRAVRPAGRRRWSCSTSTTPTSRSSSRPRRARSTRSARCATPASTWT
jgi:ribonucleoside-diphosphate reductase alpha chain